MKDRMHESLNDIQSNRKTGRQIDKKGDKKTWLKRHREIGWHKVVQIKLHMQEDAYKEAKRSDLDKETDI